MSEISERAWCAGWMDGLEFALWSMLEGGPRKYGQIVVDEATLEQLRHLAKECGGWVRFGDNDEEFVGLDAWRALYDAWKRTQRE